VQGGLSEISAAMAKVAGKHGVNIHLNAPVDKLLIEQGSVKGVVLADGSRVLADETIVNADFARAMQTLVPPGILKKYSPERLRKKRYSCSTFMLYLGIDKAFLDLPHHSIVFARDYHKNIDDIFRTLKLSDDISFYIRNSSITDDRVAPAGKSGIYVLVPVPNNSSGIDWATEKSRFRDLVLDAIAARTPMGDLRPHIEVESVITPADWEQSGVFYGATFNLAHNMTQMLYFRPHNKFEELDHCYLVGGGTHPGSGLPTIYQSGLIAAHLIGKKYGQ
jgi:phytoene desaturase